MSPLSMASSKPAAVSVEQLTKATEALGGALETGGAQLPDAARTRAAAVVTKVRERQALTGGHTVVALAGATGSGKSSLFNRIVGDEVATIGARRPTTSAPTAAIWGDGEAGPLLEWLGVKQRHHVSADDRLDGLVLLDLPDFDSRELSNRVEAERLLELVDLFVWVTDPQKYADARLHDDYVSALSAHGAVTVVVLNQADRLSEKEVEACVADLRRLMARDGIPDATVIPTSARTGLGVDELQARLVDAVAGAGASRQRLAADIRTAAGRLSDAVGPSEPNVRANGETGLIDALARAAGVPIVVGAVVRDHRMRAASFTGWPLTRWTQRLRPRPLRRLRLNDSDGMALVVDEAEVRTVLGRSSLPPPTPAARAAVDLATRELADRTGAQLPPLWSDAVYAASVPPQAELADALDQAIIGVSLSSKTPGWWRVVGALHIVFFLTAVVGLLWLLALMLVGWLQFPIPEPPMLGPLPYPFVMLVGGLVIGALLAMLSRNLARLGARHRGREVDASLREAVREVAEKQIVVPLTEVLERHRQTRIQLSDAAA